MSDSSKSLYIHVRHPHVPRNANVTHKAEQDAANFNIRLALYITEHTGTMQTTYVFAGIGIGSLVGYISGNYLLAVLCGGVSSYFLQLVLLPLLMVSQKVGDRKAEIQSDEMFHFTEKSYHNSEQEHHHMDAQDVELLKQTEMLTEIEQQHGKQLDTILQTLIDRDDATALVWNAIAAKLGVEVPKNEPAKTVAKKVATKKVSAK